METKEMKFILATLVKAPGNTMPISSMVSRYALAGHTRLQDALGLLIKSNRIEILNETHLRLKH